MSRGSILRPFKFCLSPLTPERRHGMPSSQDSPVTFRRVPAGLNRRDLRGFACVLQEEVAGGEEFHVLITGDRTLQRLNREFRGKDSPTDVLSFPAMDGKYLGDIAISWQRAAAQAGELHHHLEQELQILMLHGLLHLLGMDHERARERGKMARAESDWLQRLGLPAGLIERAHA